MDNERLKKAVELKEKIDLKNKVIRTIVKMQECADKRFNLTDYNNTVLIPENLRNVFFTLLKEHYESELHKLI